LIVRYTKRSTPENIRTDAAELTDDELMLLGDALDKYADMYKREFVARRPATFPA
jgi:hypothetical protein